VALLAAAYAAIIILMKANEDRMVFVPAPYPGDEAARAYGSDACAAEKVTSRDGTVLDALYARHPAPERHVVFFHGNGGTIHFMGRAIRSLSESLVASVLAVDYRGYGRSAGVPGERGILEDGEAAGNRLAEIAGVPRREIVVMGHSLGGAVAVHVAATGGAKALVLENTFLDLPDVASRTYPWLPVRALMKNRFPSRDEIRRYDGPLFQRHAIHDAMVPFSSGRALFDLSPSRNKRFLPTDHGGHNDAAPDAYYAELLAFLRAL
jgi:fermentation-respiration switch protein FrsA (DUF1100 family)